MRKHVCSQDHSQEPASPTRLYPRNAITTALQSPVDLRSPEALLEPYTALEGCLQ
jgi:hypothetical protein